MDGKRPHEDDISSQKRTKLKLMSSLPENSSESDTESIHSYQGYKTELANDTSDASSSSATQPFDAEYEVVEPEKVKLKFYLSDDSLEQESLKYEIFNMTSSDSLDNGLLGDTSEENSTSPTSNSDVDPGLPRSDYLDFEKCLLCQTVEKDISYPYCSTCFSWKKNLFPERPRGKKRDSKENESQSDSLNINGENSNLNNNESENHCEETNTKSSPSLGSFDDSGVGSTDTVQSEDTVDGPSQTSQISQPSTSSSVLTSASTSTTNRRDNFNRRDADMCGVCFINPENGLFVHLKTAHKYGCYSCAKEIWYQNGGCPLCRRKVCKVTKLYL